MLTVIRRVMPRDVANEILGVSPAGNSMNFWKDDLANMGNQAGHVNPAIYNSFLRLNNRRKTQFTPDFDSAGYYGVCVSWFVPVYDMREWCNDQFGQHGYYSDNGIRWWFVTNDDAMLFKLVWM